MPHRHEQERKDKDREKKDKDREKKDRDRKKEKHREGRAHKRVYGNEYLAGYRDGQLSSMMYGQYGVAPMQYVDAMYAPVSTHGAYGHPMYGVYGRPPMHGHLAPRSREHDSAIQRNLHVWSQWRTDVNNKLISHLLTGDAHPIPKIDDALRARTVYDGDGEVLADPLTLMDYATADSRLSPLKPKTYFAYGLPRVRTSASDRLEAPRTRQTAESGIYEYQRNIRPKSPRPVSPRPVSPRPRSEDDLLETRYPERPSDALRSSDVLY